MSDIAFHCPYCAQGLSSTEERAGEAIECPQCHRQIFIEPDPEPVGTAIAMPKSGGATNYLKRGIPTKADRLKVTADKFLDAARIFLLICVVMASSAAIAAVAQSPQGAWVCIGIAGCVLFLSFGFYLVGQIVHIRANTEK